MKIHLPEIKKEPLPKGKCTVKETVWGNTNAYVGGRFWKTLGPTYAVGTKEAVEKWIKDGE